MSLILMTSHDTGLELASIDDAKKIMEVIANARPVRSIAYPHTRDFAKQNGNEFVYDTGPSDNFEIKFVNGLPSSEKEEQEFIDCANKKEKVKAVK